MSEKWDFSRTFALRLEVEARCQGFEEKEYRGGEWSDARPGWREDERYIEGITIEGRELPEELEKALTAWLYESETLAEQPLE